MTAFILAWCSAFAVYEAACLLTAAPLPWLHAIALALHTGMAALVLCSAMRHRRAMRELAAINAYARALLRVEAWGRVYMDRRARGAPLSRALLGLSVALDRAESEKARLVDAGVLS